MSQIMIEQPIRAAVFAALPAAQDTVRRLLEAGFSTDQITVVCSDENKERHFREFEHEHPAGTDTPMAVSIGGTIGAVIGGLGVAVAGLTTDNVPLALSGGAAGACTGGVLGGFLGAMLTRGAEKEPADFYDQAVVGGQILVAVEVHGEAAEVKLATAEKILAQSGAMAIPLPEG